MVGLIPITTLALGIFSDNEEPSLEDLFLRAVYTGDVVSFLWTWKNAHPELGMLGAMKRIRSDLAIWVSQATSFDDLEIRLRFYIPMARIRLWSGGRHEIEGVWDWMAYLNTPYSNPEFLKVTRQFVSFQRKGLAEIPVFSKTWVVANDQIPHPSEKLKGAWREAGLDVVRLPEINDTFLSWSDDEVLLLHDADWGKAAKISRLPRHELQRW